MRRTPDAATPTGWAIASKSGAKKSFRSARARSSRRMSALPNTISPTDTMTRSGSAKRCAALMGIARRDIDSTVPRTLALTQTRRVPRRYASVHADQYAFQRFFLERAARPERDTGQGVVRD